MTTEYLAPYRSDLELLCRTLGVPGQGTHRSAFRDDRSPSMSVFADSDGVARWRDHGTDDGGDVFDAVMRLQGCSFSEAVKHVTGAPLVDARPTSRSAKPKVLSRPEPLEPVPDTAAIQAFSEKLSAHFIATKPLQLEALKKRGIAPATAATYGVTYFEALSFEQSGQTFKNAWAIPIPHADGRYLAVKLHLENQTPKAWWAPLGTTKGNSGKLRHGWSTLFPPPEWFSPSEVLYITEGELKALALLSIGKKAVSPTAGANFKWTPGNIKRLVNRNVVIVFDDDKAGIEFKERSCRALVETVSSLRSISFTPIDGRMCA